VLFFREQDLEDGHFYFNRPSLALKDIERRLKRKT